MWLPRCFGSLSEFYYVVAKVFSVVFSILLYNCEGSLRDCEGGVIGGSYNVVATP